MANNGTPKKGEVRNPWGRAGKPLAPATKTDGWQNVFTLAGGKRDRTTQSAFIAASHLDRDTLDDLYVAGGVARRIVDVVALDATRQWITTDDDNAEALQDRMEELDLQTSVSQVLSMSRLHGGSVMVVLADDGRELSEPLNENGIRSIDGFRIYDRWCVSWTPTDLYADPRQRKYGHPERYTIAPPGGGQYVVHESRLVRFDGMPVSERKRVDNKGWNYSYIQPVYQAMMDLDSAHRSSASIVSDFVQTVMSIKGLTEMIAGGNESHVAKRLEILDMSRSVLNTLLMDADGEQFSKQASSVAGLSDLLQAFRIQVSSITGIPMTKLFGISPGGLNATGESDLRNYYDEVANYQTATMRKPLERLVRMMMLEKSGAYKGREPSKWSLIFNPLWQMSDKEVAEIKKITAETDAIYMDRGVYTEAEVAQVRSEPEGWKKHIELTQVDFGDE